MAKRICDPTSGSIGRQTYLLGRNGQVVRNRVVPLNPNTSYQKTVRTRLAQVAQSWRGLTASEITGWNSVAKAYASKTRLNQSGGLTGEQLFCKLNCNLAFLGDDQITTPTAVPDFGELAVTGLNITNTAGTILIKLSAPTAVGENHYVRASKGVSAGISRTPRLVMLGMVPAPVTGVSNITSLYTVRWPIPAVGQKVFVSVSKLQDGWESPAAIFEAVVPASA